MVFDLLEVKPLTSPLLAREAPNFAVPFSPCRDIVDGRAESLDDFTLPPTQDAAEIGILSTRAITANVILSITGTTVLGVAAQMKLGWVVAPVCMITASSLISEMTRLVSVTIQKLQDDKNVRVRAYQDFAGAALGQTGQLVSSVTCTSDIFCAICIGLILESQNLQFLFPISLPWFGRSDSGQTWWAFLLSFVTLVYSFVDLGPLAKCSSIIAPAVCFCSVVLAIAGPVKAQLSSGGFPESCRSSGMEPYWQLLPNDNSGAAVLLLNSVGVMTYCIYCFAMISTVPSLRSEMTEPKKLPMAAAGGYFTCVIIFFGIMFTAYSVYGIFTPDNIIQGMRAGRPAGWWATTSPWETGSGGLLGLVFSALVTTNMLLIDCTYVPCSVIAVEGSCPGLFGEGPRGSRRRSAARIMITIARFIIATEVTSFIPLSSMCASLFCVCNNFLIPIAAYYKTKAEQTGPLRKAFHGVVFLVGCFLAVVGCASAMRAIVAPPAGDLGNPGSYPRHGITRECVAAYMNATAA